MTHSSPLPIVIIGKKGIMEIYLLIYKILSLCFLLNFKHLYLQHKTHHKCMLTKKQALSGLPFSRSSINLKKLN